MRNKFDEQLKRLHVELIQMGAACEDAISAAAEALLKGDVSLASAAVESERELDRLHRATLTGAVELSAEGLEQLAQRLERSCERLEAQLDNWSTETERSLRGLETALRGR